MAPAALAGSSTEHRSVGAWGYNGSGQLGDNTWDSRTLPVQVRGPRAPFLTGVSSVSANQYYSAARLDDGTVATWGDNSYGQLGSGGYSWRLTPDKVVGPGGAGTLRDVVGIAAGMYHCLAVKSDGTVWGWGQNWYGQIGDGTANERLTPVQVVGPGGVGHLSGIIAVDTYDNHSIALASDGTVWTWGANWFGELGNGTTADSLTPVQVVGVGGSGFLTGVVGIAAGNLHSVALLSDKTVVTWGDNSEGQLGLGVAGGNSETPKAVTGLTDVVQVAAGWQHSIARRSGGGLRAWGDNSHGQLGDGTTTRRAAPVAVSGITTADFVACGQQHSLCILADGSARAWGYNGEGELGDGTNTNQPTPVTVSGLTGGSTAAAATNHSLFRTSDGRVWSCGYNGYGALGNDTWTNSATPVAVIGISDGFLTDASLVSCGSQASLAVKTDGTAWAWGWNGYGQLGDGTTNTSRTPVQVVGPGGVGFLTDVKHAAMAYDHSVACRADGSVWAWGFNNYGQLGDGTYTSSSTPVQVIGPLGSGYLTDVVRVASGTYHNLALKSDGTVWAWGANWLGQLGDGTTNSSPYPVQVLGPAGEGVLTGVLDIACGLQHSLAVLSDGTVVAWGDNSYGQLGIGLSLGYSELPLPALAITGATRVSAAEYYSMAIGSGGSVWSWGNNGYGQLGDGTTTDRNTPAMVAGLPPCTAVSAGYYHALAMTAAGGVWSWGINWYGELGDGTNTDHLTPAQVRDPDNLAPLNHIRAIAAGDYHSLALWVNTVPVPDPQSVTAITGVAKPIVLSGSDGDGDPLTFKVVSGPVHGNLTGTAPNLVYTSAPDFSGVDTFTFVADDTYDASEPATVTVNVEKAATSTLVTERTATISEQVGLRCYLKRIVDGAWVVGRTVEFKVDGTSVGTATTDANGRADKNWVITEGPATRTVTAHFDGDASYKPSSGSALLHAQSWGTKMVTFNRTARITDRTELKARLLRSDNAPIYGRSIRFHIDGTFIIARNTNVDGYAIYPNYDVPNGAGAGARTILCEWVGNGGYAAISKTATLTVLKAIPYIWVLGKNVPYGGIANLYAYFRRLYDYQKQVDKTVDFKIDGTSVQTVVTDGVGVARYLYPTTGMSYGGHTIRCEFLGDAWLDAGYGENYLNIY